MDSSERRTVAIAAFLHGLVHANILSIPVYLELAWRSEFGTDDVAVGLLAATAAACFGLSSVPFGHMADRKGAKWLLVACAAGIAASLGLLAASPNLPAVVAALVALGLASGLYHPTGLALISRTVREAGRGMGWHGMGGSLGVAFGPATVGALLLLGWSWRTVAGLFALPALLALGFVLIARPADVAASRVGTSLSSSVRRVATRGFQAIFLVYLFAGLAYWGSLTFLPRFVGAGSFALLLGLGAVGQVASGYLADRARPEASLAGLTLAAAALLAAFAAFPGFSPIAWAFGFLLFSLEPLQNTLVIAEVPKGARGAAFGMTFLAVFGLGSAGAALAGILMGAGLGALLFVALAGFLVASSGFAILAGRRRGPG